MSEYEPFGDEWKKEMKGFKKDDLIELLSKTCKQRIQLLEACESLVEYLDHTESDNGICACQCAPYDVKCAYCKATEAIRICGLR